MAPLLGIALQALPSLVGMFDDDAGEVAEKAAGVVASVLGTTDPAEARRRLEANPEIALQLKEALYNFQIQIEREKTKRLQSVNQTMQAETQAKHWWSSAWRPFWGACSAVVFFLAVIGILILAGKAVTTGNQAAINMIPTLVTNLTLLFGVPGAILGVASWHRGKEKRIQAGER
ncbi:MAG: 3TM-type holin [Candidatus Sedimenticola sp. (ex Thyasira tokunagai)]